jgi:hypothetical protein
MKYYETTFDEYINAVDQYNLHPELYETYKTLPQSLNDFENTIIYGPVGIGKYSQSLCMLMRYSPTNLKYDSKITATTDKQTYNYHISDIHYEVDMSLLGCNSKTLWSEIFFQIVDIISMKSDKVGIILCKNFHLIHSELLEIFYSYIQQYNHSNRQINIKFLIITESISFIPTNIVNACQLLRIGRPTMDKYYEITDPSKSSRNFINRILPPQVNNSVDNITYNSSNIQQSDTEPNIPNIEETVTVFNNINEQDITNIKELKSFDLLNRGQVPSDIFNTVCDQIINDIENSSNMNYIEFRDSLYNILTYNLDVAECLWYILTHFIHKDVLCTVDVTHIVEKTYLFFKYYNNNYRPIYHLESIMFYIINKLNNYDEL